MVFQIHAKRADFHEVIDRAVAQYEQNTRVKETEHSLREEGMKVSPNHSNSIRSQFPSTMRSRLNANRLPQPVRALESVQSTWLTPSKTSSIEGKTEDGQNENDHTEQQASGGSETHCPVKEQPYIRRSVLNFRSPLNDTPLLRSDLTFLSS